MVDKEKEKDLKGKIVIRGGGADVDPSKLKFTSTYRAFVARDRKDKVLGFRLVREN